MSNDEAYDPDAEGCRGGGFDAVPRHADFGVFIDHVLDGKFFVFVFTCYDDCARTPACRCLSQTHSSDILIAPMWGSHLFCRRHIPSPLRTQQRYVYRSSIIRLHNLPLHHQPSRFRHSLRRRRLLNHYLISTDWRLSLRVSVGDWQVRDRVLRAG